MRLIQGDRVGSSGTIRVGASAVVFDDSRQKVLQTRRSDNGRWCLPGGSMDSGESAEEACIREISEETGLDVEITRLVGIYTSPDILVEYDDGNRYQPVVLSFEATVKGGQLQLSDETTEVGFFTDDEFHAIDLMERQELRIQDARKNQEAALIR